ncbi:hypothetical protein MNBD_ALPHA08-239 [hydrothermal vent metagenome]|uniref:DUF2267 domain-containing protein n=1 Tax=hydrothermal vent metagenome TaxID=652676 RepID=A0A3B0RHL7_9ZZZZ
MQDLVISIAAKMGIDEALAEKAVSIVLSLVQSQGDDGLVGQLFEKMPGADALATAGTTAIENGDGGGGLMGKLGGMLGGGAGDIMAAVAQLKSDGLDPSQIKEVGGEVLGFAKEKGGADLVDQITSSIPGLEKFL